MRATAHDLSKPDPQVLPADQEPAAKPYLPYDDHLMEEADEAHRKTIEIRLFEAEWLGDGVLHAQCRAEMEQLLAVQIARGIRDIHNGFMSELEDLQKQLKKHQLWDHHQHKHQSRGLKATSQETALKTHKSAIHVMRQGSASGPDGLGEGTANGRGGVRDHVEEQCRCTRANQDAEVQTLTSALADREDEIRQMGAAMAASEEEVASLRREIEAQEVAYAGRVREIEARISAREAEVVVELWEASKAHEMVCRISVADREAKVRALTSALRESEAAGCSLRKAMAARETDVACLRREMEDARVEAAQKYAALVSSSAEMHGVLEALDASGRTIEAAEREKTAAESKCAEIEQMIRNRASEVEVLRRRDVELTVEVEKCAEDLRQSKASLVRKHEHVVALRSRMANFEWSLALAFDDLRTAAKEQIELMHTGSEGAERRLDEAVCELRGMATRMDENVAKLTGELQSSQDQVAGLIKVRDEKEERIKGLQQDVKDKEEALKSSQEEVARLMQLQAEKEESIKGLQQDVKDMEASVSKLNDELKSLQGVMAGLVKVRDEKEECIKGLQQDVKDKNKALKSSQEDVKNKDETVSRLTLELQSSHAEEERLIKVRNEQQECIKGLHQDVKDKEESEAKLCEELRTTEVEVMQLVKVKSCHEDCIKKLKQDVVDKEEGADKLREELATAQVEAELLSKVKSELQEKTRALQRDSAQQSQIISSLEQSVQEKERTATQMSEELQSLRNQQERLVLVQKEKEDRIQTLEQTSKNSKKQLQSMLEVNMCVCVCVCVCDA